MYEAFTGEAVIKKSSLAHRKLGTAIASPLFFARGRRRDGARGAGSSPYDGEDVATRRNLLVDRGTCASFAYDHYHAAARSPLTGNGIRGFGSTPGIGYHNLYVPAGETSPEAMIRSVDRGFYFDDRARSASTR